MWALQYAFIVANGGHIGVTTCGHIGNLSGLTNKRGTLCHLISIQSTYFIRQLQVENVRDLIFFAVTPLYSSGGHSNMAALGFSFLTIDARSSPIFQISNSRLNKLLPFILKQYSMREKSDWI